MKKDLEWTVAKSADGKAFEDFIPAGVPGNVQLDYAKAKGFADDWQVGTNYHKFDGLEDCYWKYRAVLTGLPAGKEHYFVAHGIDYCFDVFLDGKRLFSYEGMFAKNRVLLEGVHENSVLEVLIHPAPKHPLIKDGKLDASRIPWDRAEADRSVKPAVGYGWDFHPRLIVQGIWDEAYIESLDKIHLVDMRVNYEVTNIGNATGDIELTADVEKTGGKAELYLYDGENNVVAHTDGNRMSFRARLWYPHNMGEQPLYRLCAVLKDENRHTASELNKKIGFRAVELLMNEGAWEQSEISYPLSRAFCAFQLSVNGQKVFAKGSNWVNPEIFVGTITEKLYREQLQLVKDCNMSILRVWGGAIVNKDAFFDICDKLGIMVWQEFPLACNNYVNDKHYLSVLEQEAIAIVERVKPHPCHVIWCGGNELFNSWSAMTDQSFALRLLNKICYERDAFTPFLATSPVYGVKHGPYRFNMYGRDVYKLFNEECATGYVEFGMPSMVSYEQLEKFIPKKDLQKFENSLVWREHFAFDEENKMLGNCDYISVTDYFGETTDVKKYVEHSQFLACTGYTYIFEEGRRQQPMCSMMMNWCFNEPWYCAANNSIVGYGTVKKPSYDAVKNALKPVTVSLRMGSFSYRKGDCFEGEIHVLNDSGKPSGVENITAYFDDGEKTFLGVFKATGAKENEFCGRLCFSLEKSFRNLKEKSKLAYVILQSENEEKRYPVMLRR